CQQKKKKGGGGENDDSPNSHRSLALGENDASSDSHRSKGSAEENNKENKSCFAFPEQTCTKDLYPEEFRVTHLIIHPEEALNFVNLVNILKVQNFNVETLFSNQMHYYNQLTSCINSQLISEQRSNAHSFSDQCFSWLRRLPLHDNSDVEPEARDYRVHTGRDRIPGVFRFTREISKFRGWQVHHMKVLSRVDRYRYRKALFVGFMPYFGLRSQSKKLMSSKIQTLRSPPGRGFESLSDIVDIACRVVVESSPLVDLDEHSTNQRKSRNHPSSSMAKEVKLGNITFTLRHNTFSYIPFYIFLVLFCNIYIIVERPKLGFLEVKLLLLRVAHEFE
uniref:Uncharacterized protein n=1 Tax=Cucumis melo TaxID=3656 RepID=A0A9I9E8D1_CUCME